jgi:AMMECR1 domain-containing protein
VADSREWTREEFLGALARKAGLPGDGWSRHEARLFVFEAQRFSTTVPPSAL